MMANGDREGCSFLSLPHRNNGFFFLFATKYCILYWKKNIKRLLENSEYAEIRDSGVILTLQCRHESTSGCSFFIFPMGWYGYVR